MQSYGRERSGGSFNYMHEMMIVGTHIARRKVFHHVMESLGLRRIYIYIYITAAFQTVEYGMWMWNLLFFSFLFFCWLVITLIITFIFCFFVSLNIHRPQYEKKRSRREKKNVICM